MAKTKTPLGNTGESVSANIKRLRTDQKLTYAELSRRLEKLGNPIPPLGLRRIEDGERKVDVDDLAALGIALDTIPNYLLMPLSETKEDQVGFTGLGTVQAEPLWSWLLHAAPHPRVLTGERPPIDPDNPSDDDATEMIDNMARTMPPWQLREMFNELQRIKDNQDRRQQHGDS